MKVFIKILKWIPALLIFSCSWYLSSQEKIEYMPSFWSADKLVHCVCFAGLAFWVAFACSDNVSNTSNHFKFIVPILIVSIYGIVDEIHQSFTPGRSSSIFDWIADTVGAVTGVFFFLIICKVLKKILIRYGRI